MTLRAFALETLGPLSVRAQEGPNRKALDGCDDWSARNNFLVPALVCCRPAIQRGVPGRRVRVRTAPWPFQIWICLL